MIKIIFYNNGFEIKGHASPKTCGEVSILAWATANVIGKIDSSALYYTSAIFGKNDGYTCFEFNKNHAYALQLYCDLKNNAQLWGKEIWKEEVSFEHKDCDFNYPFTQEVSDKTRF